METTKSEQTPKQIAEQAWISRCMNVTNRLPCVNPECGMREGEVMGRLNELLSDYKQALREAIENRKKFIEECIPPDNHYDARKKGGLHEIEKILELIETVTPKE